MPLLEVQAKLRPELAFGVVLRPDIAKGIACVDVQRRIGQTRMVENIRGIETDLHALRFGNPKHFAHSRIESPLSGHADGLPADGAAMTGCRVLKNDLTGAGVHDRRQITEAADGRR